MDEASALEPSVRLELLAEAQGLLAAAARHLAALVGADLRRPEDAEQLSELFRAVHTLKGLAGFCGLDAVTGLAHALEDLLDALRSGRVDLDADTHALLLDSAAALGRHLAAAGERRSGEAGRMPAFERMVQEVRVLSRALSKDVRLVVNCEASSLDGLPMDALSAPLAHVLRNAVDHGIELPDERVARGKSREGSITVRAWRTDSLVALEVEDDGAGVDVMAVRSAAVARGLLDRAAAEAMGEQELLEMLFRPGFSTRAEVTGVSGRGVGLDVVRSAVARLGGNVGLRTRVGVFSRVIVTLPVSVAAV
ncbi:MAG: Hpt domain-containing protein [Deltaproteobacteria bacterium]|nr:Hpt domain-containing protein [Deltaproteobacteria bacterium]